jgi:hypothetical protein
MLKLADALVDWLPADGVQARDPIVLLDAGWREIVGDDVAQNSRPARMAGDTLIITTRSSAWSHQLSFLSEHVLRAVSARLPAAGIRRLRFTIGRLSPPRALAPPRSRARGEARPSSPERAAAASLGETLARFRGDVERRRRSRRAEGWLECADCGALLAPGSTGRCAACRALRTQRLEAATARLLYEAPWLGFVGTAALVNGLREREYERIRRRMLAHWWGILARARAAKQLAKDGRERLIASSYVLLQSRLQPEAIMPATVRNILGDELHDLLYGAPGEGRTVQR